MPKKRAVRTDSGAASKRRPEIALRFARNLCALMDHAEAEPSLADRATPKLLSGYIEARGIGDRYSTSWRHIYRARNGDVNVGLAFVEQVARAYGFEPWQLLVPGFRPKRPPKLVTLDEQRILDAIKEADMAARTRPGGTNEETEESDPPTHDDPVDTQTTNRNPDRTPEPRGAPRARRNEPSPANRGDRPAPRRKPAPKTR